MGLSDCFDDPDAERDDAEDEEDGDELVLVHAVSSWAGGVHPRLVRMAAVSGWSLMSAGPSYSRASSSRVSVAVTISSTEMCRARSVTE